MKTPPPVAADRVTKWQLHFLSIAGLIVGASHGIWVGYRVRDLELALILALVGGGVTGFVAIVAYFIWQLSRLGFMLLWYRVRLGSAASERVNRRVFFVVSSALAVGAVLLTTWIMTVVAQGIASGRAGERHCLVLASEARPFRHAAKRRAQTVACAASALHPLRRRLHREPARPPAAPEPHRQP